MVLAFAGCATAAQPTPPAQQLALPTDQTMTPPRLPFACDVTAAPLGSWAEYEARHPWLNDPSTDRVALVRKGAEDATVEMTFDVSSGFVAAIVFGPGKGTLGQVRKTTMQDGGCDPMDMPLMRSSGQSGYALPDSRSLVGTEEITVRAGSFSARRYRYLSRFGETVDVWVNDTAWPICVIKLEAEQKQDPTTNRRFSYELIATGTDAKPEITKPAVPYDLEVLKKHDAAKCARARVVSPVSGPSP